jgi:hypothetical protein
MYNLIIKYTFIFSTIGLIQAIHHDLADTSAPNEQLTYLMPPNTTECTPMKYPTWSS